MKEYEIIKEIVDAGYYNQEGEFIITGQGIEKWNICYYIDGKLVDKEFYSYDGITPIEGYKIKEGFADKNISVDNLKAYLKSKVDTKTQELIFNGFPFDGKIFSMSINAQINWSNFPMLPDALFPLTVLSKNDEEYILSYANKNTFYMTALGYKNTHLQSGDTLKKQIALMTTKEELANFIDNR